MLILLCLFIDFFCELVFCSLGKSVSSLDVFSCVFCIWIFLLYVAIFALLFFLFIPVLWCDFFGVNVYFLLFFSLSVSGSFFHVLFILLCAWSKFDLCSSFTYLIHVHLRLFKTFILFPSSLFWKFIRVRSCLSIQFLFLTSCLF